MTCEWVTRALRLKLLDSTRLVFPRIRSAFQRVRTYIHMLRLRIKPLCTKKEEEINKNPQIQASKSVYNWIAFLARRFSYKRSWTTSDSSLLLTRRYDSAMSIRYKFRSSMNFDSVDIDGRLSVSVRDLKSMVVHNKKLNICHDFDLVFSDAVTGQGLISLDFFNFK